MSVSDRDGFRRLGNRTDTRSDTERVYSISRENKGFIDPSLSGEKIKGINRVNVSKSGFERVVFISDQEILRTEGLRVEKYWSKEGIDWSRNRWMKETVEGEG